MKLKNQMVIKLELKHIFLSSQFQGRIINENFTKEFENLKIDKNCEVLVMCGSGNRSQRAAELLTEKGFKCSNISDGFRGDRRRKKLAGKIISFQSNN